MNRDRFASALNSDRLRILNVAIARREEPVTFWDNEQNDDWGTTSDDFRKRNADAGTSMRAVTVPGQPLHNILDQYGTPYYLKIDIEGSDLLCLEALRGRELPRFLSIEADFSTADALFSQMALLWELGYRNYMLVNQGANRWRRCPNPPLEGQYVDEKFGMYCSGLFGKELPGKWVTGAELMASAGRLLWEQRNFGLNAPHSRSLPGRVYMGVRRLMRNPVAWYDIHVTTGESYSRPSPVTSAAAA
jgi:FkbM family methyltransferase